MYMALLLARAAFLALHYWICYLLKKEDTRPVVYLDLRMEQILVDRWDLVPAGAGDVSLVLKKTNKNK